MLGDEKGTVESVEVARSNRINVVTEALGLTRDKYEDSGAVALDVGAKNAELGSTTLKLASDGHVS